MTEYSQRNEIYEHTCTSKWQRDHFDKLKPNSMLVQQLDNDKQKIVNFLTELKYPRISK